MSQYIFIDESGDPGLASGCSQHFVMSAVVFPDAEAYTELESIVKSEKLSNKISQLAEYKFAKTKKEYIVSLLQKITKLDLKIYYVVNNKSTREYSNRYSIYIETLQELLNIINPSNANVYIDGQAGKKHIREVSKSLRKSLSPEAIHKIRFIDSNLMDGLQIADLSAGAIARSHTDKPDANLYFRLLSSKIAGIEE